MLFLTNPKFQVSPATGQAGSYRGEAWQVELKGGTREVKCEMFKLRTFPDTDTDTDTDAELIGEGG